MNTSKEKPLTLSDSEEEDHGFVSNISFGEKVCQLILNTPVSNQNDINNYLGKLKDCIISQNQSTNNIVGNSNFSYKDVIQSIDYSFLSPEIADFLKNISEDIFIVTQMTISNKPLNSILTSQEVKSKDKKEIKKLLKFESEKFRLLDSLANVGNSKRSFTGTSKSFLKQQILNNIAIQGTGKNNNTNNNIFNENNFSNNENQPPQEKNPFETSLVTIYKGTRLRLTSKEKIVFLDADYSQIISLERFDVLNMLFLISSCFLINGVFLNDDYYITSNSTNKHFLLNKMMGTHNSSNTKVIESFISTMKESIKTNIQFKVSFIIDKYIIYIYICI